MNQIYVVPAAGRTVPDPVRKDVLPPAGRHVRKSPYWARRVADGDVILKAAPKAAPAKPKEP